MKKISIFNLDLIDINWYYYYLNLITSMRTKTLTQNMKLLQNIYIKSNNKKINENLEFVKIIVKINDLDFIIQ